MRHLVVVKENYKMQFNTTAHLQISAAVAKTLEDSVDRKIRRVKYSKSNGPADGARG